MENHWNCRWFLQGSMGIFHGDLCLPEGSSLTGLLRTAGQLIPRIILKQGIAHWPFSSCTIFEAGMQQNTHFEVLMPERGWIYYHPKQRTIQGKSLKTTIHLHCLTLPKRVYNLMIPAEGHQFESRFKKKLCTAIQPLTNIKFLPGVKAKKLLSRMWTCLWQSRIFLVNVCCKLPTAPSRGNEYSGMKTWGPPCEICTDAGIIDMQYHTNARSEPARLVSKQRLHAHLLLLPQLCTAVKSGSKSLAAAPPQIKQSCGGG